MDKNWIAQMISGTERAITAGRRSGFAGEETKLAASESAKKYFSIGMHLEDASKLLDQLKADGFLIREYHKNGSKAWPDGMLQKYMDEETRININHQYSIGAHEVNATKTWRSRLIVDEFYSIDISISMKTNRIIAVSANRHATSL